MDHVNPTVAERPQTLIEAIRLHLDQAVEAMRSIVEMQREARQGVSAALRDTEDKTRRLEQLAGALKAAQTAQGLAGALVSALQRRLNAEQKEG